MNASEDSTPSTSADALSRSLQALGASLRQAREDRGISLTDMASQLRMGDEQLLALESGDRDGLPELVFVIAQARRVADALHYDISPLIAPLKLERSAIKPAPARISSSERQGRERRPARLTAQSYTKAPAQAASPGRWLGSLALVAGMAAAGTWGWQQRSTQQLIARPKNATAPAAVKPTQPALKPAALKPAAVKPQAVKPQAVVVNELKLKAVQPSWLEVRTGAGKQLFEGTFKGERAFPLKGGLQLLAGRPDLVQVSLGDGPARPLGRIDQISWVSFKAPTR